MVSGSDVSKMVLSVGALPPKRRWQAHDGLLAQGACKGGICLWQMRGNYIPTWPHLVCIHHLMVVWLISLLTFSMFVGSFFTKREADDSVLYPSVVGQAFDNSMVLIWQPEPRQEGRNVASESDIGSHVWYAANFSQGEFRIQCN